MVKLNLGEKPPQWTDEWVEASTNKYIEDGTAVWKIKFVQEAVLALSHQKCCYTECKLNTESRFMEIDHFYPKKHYPHDVVKWGNLLPSCKKANGTKGDLDTRVYPILNPLFDDPKDHLYIKNYRFYHKTEIGKRTIDFTVLNDRKHFVEKRFSICDKVIEILEGLKEDIKDALNSVTTSDIRLKNLVNKYKNLLNEAKRTEEYSASISTILLTEESNAEIVAQLKDNQLWDEELEDCFEELRFCALCAA